ncbi:MFS transporter [Paraburkholderia pallida]|uniref:MFS transporter n=1 Tax=Paraburkholderia pallida TaxID=2547399 RepID=UPI0014302E50|nr:MFS transporter [Paraburkholderia pallida]
MSHHLESVSAARQFEVLNVTSLIEEGALGRFQIRVYGLCALVALVDGFDSQLLGPAAASIAHALRVSVAGFGPVFSASQAGFFAGALVLGPAADWLGRRWVLVGATSVFAVFTLLTALAHSTTELLLYRFVVGFALGGASPCFIGLAAEYLPLRLRTRLVTMLWAAVPLGGMLGAAVSTALIHTAGWQALFLAGGCISLGVAVLLGFALPESAGFLVKRGAPGRKIGRLVAKITGSNVAHNIRFVINEQKTHGVPLRKLFQSGRALCTVYLWALCFMAWMALIVVSFWTPTLIQRVGFSMSAAAATLLVNNIGAVAGTVLVGSAMQRYGDFRVLAWSFLGATLSVGGLGMFTSSLSHVLMSSALSGFFLSASCAGLIAVAAESYPTSVRSTGIGWAIGVGRIGSIVGPMFAGQLLMLQWSVRNIYLMLGIPCLCAVGLIVLLRRHTSRTGTSQADESIAI